MATTINVGVLCALLSADTARFVGGMRTASYMTAWTRGVEAEAERLGRMRTTRWPVYRFTTDLDAVTPVPMSLRPLRLVRVVGQVVALSGRPDSVETLTPAVLALIDRSPFSIRQHVGRRTSPIMRHAKDKFVAGTGTLSRCRLVHQYPYKLLDERCEI